MFAEDSFSNASCQLYLIHLPVTYTTNQLTDSMSGTIANKNAEENWQIASATAVKKNKIELARSLETRSEEMTTASRHYSAHRKTTTKEEIWGK